MNDKPRPQHVDLEPACQRIEKPWGWEVIWAEGQGYTGKIVHILPGKRLSLQYHDQKVETQCLVWGRALLVVEDTDGNLREIEMERGKGYTIRPYQIHRLIAIEEAEVYEVSTPEQGTTVRLEDDYARPNETESMRQHPNRGWKGSGAPQHLKRELGIDLG